MVISTINSSLGGLKFGKDGDGNVGYYGADGSLIPFKRYKTAEKTVSYSGNAGTFFSCKIDFSDTFPNTILGIESVVNSGSSVTPGNMALFTIDKVNRIITMPKYGGATGDVRPVSGTITVTAIGY